jgi:hypothetical protein
MHIRILDLDGSLTAQREFVRRSDASVIPLQDWGPHIRMASSFGAYRRFERACGKRWIDDPKQPVLTFYGSGDFHHVTLALLRRLQMPFNLLVLDKHPDWMRGAPLMHCGTWLHHALRLPNIRRVFHLGGELDFDNGFRWLAPWRQLRDGTLTVVPAVRSFERGQWRAIPNAPLLATANGRLTTARLDALLAAARPDLARHPLYISLDKDVMQATDAVVNWDSGYLELNDVRCVLNWFLSACCGRVAGMDVLGDWSPVRMRGLIRRVLHWTEHPALVVNAADAAERNAATNCILLETVRSRLPLAA